MSTLTHDYRELSVAERIQLVADIWDSIASETSGSVELTARERAELRRRASEHEADPSSALPWEEVRAKLFSSRT